MPSPRAAAVALALAAILVDARAAHACVSCACGDPTLTVMGVERPFAGRLRVSTELSRRALELGGERATDTRVVLGAAYAPHARVLLAADVPLVRRTLSQLDEAGVGDLSVRAKVFVYQDRAWRPRHLISVLGGVSLPTAPRVDDAGPIELEPGTGATMPSAGVGYSYFRFPLSLHASAVASRPFGGLDGSRPATSLQSSLFVQYQPAWRFAARVGVDARVEGDHRDPVVAAARVGALPHPGHDHGAGAAGGAPWSVVAASIGGAAQVYGDVLVTAEVSIPVFEALPTGDREGVTVSVAVVADL